MEPFSLIARQDHQCRSSFLLRVVASIELLIDKIKCHRELLGRLLGSESGVIFVVISNVSVMERDRRCRSAVLGLNRSSQRIERLLTSCLVHRVWSESYDIRPAWRGDLVITPCLSIKLAASFGVTHRARMRQYHMGEISTPIVDAMWSARASVVSGPRNGRSADRLHFDVHA